uniref:uncharacterized protein LOC117162310 n=1 Tax=Bombus vancouverensis nearcticus TaxID=2705178 RepID=UPI0014388B21|nr:uncharacterized protein LOC117162310 [Bombus vancouverensis nearcticus]
MVCKNTLLNEGRTLFVDNFYTSYQLVVKFLNFRTHVPGTVRHNKEYMPNSVMSCPLKKGEMIAREDKNGIMILKCRDKPLAVTTYNNGKIGIDRSDQIVSYATTIRKSIKWYQKLALHLLLGRTIVNAHTVYQIATNKKILIRQFREILVYEWSNVSSENTVCVFDKIVFDNHRKKTKKVTHHLGIRKNQEGKHIRMCTLCYKKKRQTVSREEARKNIKRTTVYCSKCPKSPQMCLECFSEYHVI